ncbi:MAG: PAS domain S-box protein [Smithellaceae bacterium]
MKKTGTQKKISKDLKNILNQLEEIELLIDKGPAIVIIWRCTEDWPVEFISENIANLGYTKDDFLSGRISWMDVTHPDDLVCLEKGPTDDISEDTLDRFKEYRIVCKNGDILWVQDRTIAIFDNKGKISHFQGIIVDITEHKRIRQALQESETAYRTIFENTGTAVAIADENKKPLLVNNEMCQLTGFSKEELLAADWITFVAPQDRERLRGYHRLRLTDPEAAPRHYEYQIITKYGDFKDVFMVSELIPDTKKSLVSMIDITGRKQAEAALSKSNELLQELFRSSRDIICILDKNGIFQYVSPSLTSVTNHQEHELIGKSCFEFIYFDDRKLAINAFSTLVTGKNRGIVTEFRFRKADGTWIYLEALGNNCLDNTAIKGIIINARDVSARKRMEDQLLQAHKMQAIGTLASGIAHDFNNLLMGIQGYISLMLLHKDSGDPEFDKLNKMQSLVQSGADLTANLLGFARGGQYELKPADINELVSKTANIFGRTKKEILIHQKYEKNILPVEVDRVQIEQVLINIYVNSWQAMPGDGGDIYVETDNITLSDADAPAIGIKEGDYVRIMISDTGSGMDEETRRRVFEPFFTTKEQGRGAGLGLASAYGIIKAHGGVIDVTSELGHGTIFSIYLPASAKKISRETIDDKTMILGNETILLVDDEESIIDVCGEILDTLGYNVLQAANGADALKIYETNKGRIDLVILDMIMPGLSGGETFDALKLIDPEAKVMLSSGYMVSDQAKRIMDKGCHAFIQKPFRMEELSRKIRGVLDRRG